MDMDLNGVIEKIQAEGVNKAEEQAAAIIKEAESKAAEINSAAQQQKDMMLKKAEKKADGFRTTGEAAVKQAARDVVIALRVQMEKLLDPDIRKRMGANGRKAVEERLNWTAIARQFLELVE